MCFLRLWEFLVCSYRCHVGLHSWGGHTFGPFKTKLLNQFLALTRIGLILETFRGPPHNAIEDPGLFRILWSRPKTCGLL